MTSPIRAVISDLDGVVWRGEAPIPEAVATLSGWSARGVPLAFVTNNSACSAQEFATRLQGLGIAVDPGHVITPIEALDALLRDRHAGARVYVIGAEALSDAVRAAGATVVTGPEADVVVLGTDYGLSFEKLRIATNALLGGAVLVATNPDTLSPVADGFEPCVGSLVALFKAAVPGLETIVLGKPQPALLRAAMARLGAAAHETVMIGDQVSTDIRAAEAAGVRGFRITTNPHQVARPDDPLHEVIDRLDEIAPA
ncbi:MAG: phosphotransferase [Rhodobacteraceae bacterium]|mgnify:CR=1 FL=1|jgi:4-nitrophenyl phosphatase|uniref:4-nitrophenyl phosphatase n=1 Tax=Salipiger profundus TaxID=1229727 RepID=A0A1U7D8I9_9RHOB|nr:MULTISPECIES: HAD-IIA family hydrolase [Salipiger]APX24380.1 4-nitrophenyl phosphatase [Salipiger profundus]MAB07318.1 phosphotransferase [Paracoccaceae bacterium]GGA19538.1 acid sugar phosphatase [Salipiger profundus]SFD36969.1 4-nitrophenyl phosphatase [Salipiger profundus]